VASVALPVGTANSVTILVSAFLLAFEPSAIMQKKAQSWDIMCAERAVRR
jgi:hypothetical protein